jgi:hypothetical protein
VWEGAERVSVLLGFLIAALLAALSLYGISVVLEPTFYQKIAVALGLWFVFLMLVVTPYRLWREQAVKIETLEREKLSANELTQRRKRLAKLDASGVRIRNDGMKLKTVEKVPAWVKRVSRWRKETITAIAEIDEADAEEFKTLNKTDHALKLATPLNDQHEIQFRCHDERLFRLSELQNVYRSRSHQGAGRNDKKQT